jgi:hypothetical protein
MLKIKLTYKSDYVIAKRIIGTFDSHTNFIFRLLNERAEKILDVYPSEIRWIDYELEKLDE